MSKLLKKIESFTLTELLVVMAISVVVVGLAFSVLSLLQKNVLQIQANLSGKTELRLLEQQLSLDLQKYPEVRYSKGMNRLVFSSPIDSVSYHFEQQYIVRQLDTFTIVPREKEFFFTGKAIANGTLDALKFSFSEKERTQSIFLFKRNDALTQMNNGN